MRELKVTVIMASRWTVGGVGGVSGSSEDSDLEDEWVERWVINIYHKKFPFSCLTPTWSGDCRSLAVLSLPGTLAGRPGFTFL